jgi:acetyltransferase-like isoleucine patch superfamily enzyme
MNFRESLLTLLQFRPKLVSLAYNKLYYWFFFRMFFGRYFYFIGKAGLWIHHSTHLNMLGSRIIVENGFLSVGYDDVFDTKGATNIGLVNSTLHITGNVILRPKVSIGVFGAHLTIGNGSVINGPATILSKAGVCIGEHCHFGMNTTIMDCDMHKHALAGEKPEDIPKEIIIKDHCWIGHNVTILKGVTIGEGSIVGAHSVVTKDVKDRTMVAGVPARKIKENVIWEP